MRIKAILFKAGVILIKVIFLIVAIPFLYYCVNYYIHDPFRQGGLVAEVYRSEKPERFKPRQIDEIVEKYIQPGMSKSEARDRLASAGFPDAQIASWPNELKDPEYDSMGVSAGYERNLFLDPLNGYWILIRVYFKNDSAEKISGRFGKMIY